MSFTISEISSNATQATYGLLLDPAADPGSDGIGSFDLELIFDPAKLAFIPGSMTLASGFSGFTNEAQAASGTVGVNGIIFPTNWTSFGDSLITFKFNITSAGPSEDLLIDNLFLDGISQADVLLEVPTGNTPPNAEPTGSVTISGTATEDQTLTADASGVGDPDGLGAFSYQWKANGANIGGATASTYTLTQAEVGKTITVTVSYQDGGGTNESVTSGATSSVINVNDDPAGNVTISGIVSQGETLTASNNLTDEDGLGTVTYQWNADGTPIPGAGSASYQLTQGEVGKIITVTASYTDQQGAGESVTSAATAAVNGSPTGAVSITGTPTEDQTLTADTSALGDPDGLGTFSYQWKANGANIGGATAATYTLTQAEVGKAITVTISYQDGGGFNENVTSGATSSVANINDAPTGSVVVNGTPANGQVLTADTSGLADPDGLGAFSYQWKASGVDIDGATAATYRLTQAEVGKTITVTASYTDGQGTGESVSSDPTSSVTDAINGNNGPVGSVQVTGTLELGQTLTASNSLSDEDGLGPITYTWFALGSTTPLSTGPNYVLTQAEVGKIITVTASYTDGQGNEESVSSPPTSPVTSGNSGNNGPVGSVLIAGTLELGQTLTASDSLSDEDGLGPITYTWFALGSTTPLSTGPNYVLTQADVGKSITVTASYTDGQGNEESVSSAATNPVIGFNNEPTGTVTILGEATVDGELTAINNLADTDELGPISYQWYADGIAISGSTSALYKPVLGDKGKALTVVAFYTDGQGNAESVSSDPTDPVNNDGDLIQGTAGPDSLSGGDRDDTILGLEGRDTLRGQGGDDTLQGDEDIDTVVYDGALYGAEGISNYTLVRDGEQIAVTGPAADGNDLLIDVERVQFSDLSVAFDIDGHAGQVAKLLGAVIGKEDWYNPEFVGIGLNILDQPEFSFEILMEAALDVVLGLDRSNADVVNMLFNNLIGEAPSQTDLNNLVDPMDRGEFTQVELCILAAEHPINQLNIGLAELVETGLGYIPLA